MADTAGGDWPERGRVAAVALVALSKESTPSLGVRLLADLRDVLGNHDAMSTEGILTALTGVDEAPWADLKGGPLNARGLAQRLRQYEITSTDIRTGAWHGKGYKREDFADAWSRYLSRYPGSLDETSRGGEEAAEPPLGAPHRESATSATAATTGSLNGARQTLIDGWDDDPADPWGDTFDPDTQGALAQEGTPQ